MTAIVITPFDSEHAEELKGYIENELDNADFNWDMPASVELVDVEALRQDREVLFAALADLVADSIERDPQLWHEAKRKAKQLLRELV